MPLCQPLSPVTGTVLTDGSGVASLATADINAVGFAGGFCYSILVFRKPDSGYGSCSQVLSWGRTLASLLCGAL